MTSPIPTEGGKHTPGPWFIECDGLPELRNVSTYITAGQFEDYVLICEVNTDAPDARLIAAAPALLEALQNFVAAEDELIESLKAEGRDLAAIGFPFPLVTALRAALAQATGDRQ